MTDTPSGFPDLGLPQPLLDALTEVGYESPSPIQTATIPPLLEGRDVLGQAQTGTGKTAAFALPALARIMLQGLDAGAGKPQALVLAPTRELAIQVAEAFQKYAARIPGFHVLPVYGGQSYGPQLQALRRGVHVVVGTPGRIIDHLERGSLDLSRIRMLILDEADEMLRMGFIDDVETVLQKIPEQRQVALFSATMPAPIKRIAQTYLREPVEVAIKGKAATATNIGQRYWAVSGLHKLDALTRILEVEPFDAMIIFSRTKLGTEELADKLAARGFAAAAINGDMDQKQRERTIGRLKDRQIDILVATDVAARGLDVERISHVVNYDIPYDTESYVHRIGRTGRAGRSGQAIVFVAPRERGMLRAIERATGQSIAAMELPSVDSVNERRVSKFMDTITQALSGTDLTLFRDLVERYERERNIPAVEIAAALAQRLQGAAPLLLAPQATPTARTKSSDGSARRSEGKPEGKHANTMPAGARDTRRASGQRPPTPHFERQIDPTPQPPTDQPGHPDPDTASGQDTPKRSRAPARDSASHTLGMETFRIEVGHLHGVQPSNIVGAIANEADLDSRYIGRIDIRQDHSLVDLPEGMPRELLAHLKKVRVAGQPLKMQRAHDDDPQSHAPRGARSPDRSGPRTPGPRTPGSRPPGARTPGPRTPGARPARTDQSRPGPARAGKSTGAPGSGHRKGRGRPRSP